MQATPRRSDPPFVIIDREVERTTVGQMERQLGSVLTATSEIQAIERHDVAFDFEIRGDRFILGV